MSNIILNPPLDNLIASHRVESFLPAGTLYVPDEMMPVLEYFRKHYEGLILGTNFMSVPTIQFSAQQMMLQHDSAVITFIKSLESLNATRKALEAEEAQKERKEPMQQTSF